MAESYEVKTLRVSMALGDAFNLQAEIEGAGMPGNENTNMVRLLLGAGTTGQNGTVGMAGSAFLEALRGVYSIRPIPPFNGVAMGAGPGSLQGLAQVTAAELHHPLNPPVAMNIDGGKQKRRKRHTLRKRKV